MAKSKHHNLYVAIGMAETDPGFGVISQAMNTLGDVVKMGASFWQLQTSSKLDKAFKVLNTSMLDRRIDSNASLMLLDPQKQEAKWHLRQPLSDLILANWDFQNNLLISFSLQKTENESAFLEQITRLGLWAPLGKKVWYVSTQNTSREAFFTLTESLNAGDQLSILDDLGNIANWKTGTAVAKSQNDEPQTEDQKADSVISSFRSIARDFLDDMKKPLSI